MTYDIVGHTSGILPTWQKRVRTCLKHVRKTYVHCYSTSLLRTWVVHVHTFLKMYVHVHTFWKNYKHVRTRFCQVGRIPDAPAGPRQTHSSHAIAGGGGGEVHPPAATPGP